jgi:hypothetical protein
VYQGRVVGKFGERVVSLLRSVTDSFLERTAGSLVVRERTERLGLLTNYIANAVRNLFQQQLVVVATDVTRRFQRDLVALAESQAQPADEEQQLLRKALFNFRAAASELEVEPLGLSADAAQTELTEELQKALADFPDSPAAKLVALRQVDREVRQPRKKGKGARAVNIGLSLVGMLRPPGLGSFQGFAGYSTALLGLPFDMLLGVQNDGDSAEIMGEDREHPILRLQPKVNFDIDL